MIVLLEYLDTFVLKVLMFYTVTVLLEYLDLFHAVLMCKVRVQFTKLYLRIMPACCSLRLPPYFSKNFAGKISLSSTMHIPDSSQIEEILDQIEILFLWLCYYVISKRLSCIITKAVMDMSSTCI